MKIYQSAQSQPNYEGYHDEQVQQEIVNLVGTGGTSASQILMLFSKADESIRLVNEFDSSLLSDIAYIFNFSKSGAYGVYLDELDRTIKTEELKQTLEGSGYSVVTENGVLKAYPIQENKSTEEVQQDIDVFYRQIESEGGTAFGINMNAILNLSKEAAAASNSPDPNLWELIAILHVGATIAHEATHALGHPDEGMPQQVESAFEQWALPKINQEYEAYWSSDPNLSQYEFSPIEFTGQKTHASTKGWYKESQHFFQQMQFQNLQNSPKGSDLEGRFPTKPHGEAGRGAWGKILQMQENLPIESRLSREFMAPLPEGVSQEHDTIEEQLRKYRQSTTPDHDLDSSTEELLADMHNDDASYKHTETLLEEDRPSPIMVPLEKAASIRKEATLFGWMNNLEISDGKTIPGLSDRVMLWEDRDEEFAREEEWIRKQPRYNPLYDIKGFFYRWIEPRFRPQLFNDMTQDYSNIHPARRFASTEDSEQRREMMQVMSILGHAKQKILDGEINCTRFVTTEDMLSLLHELLDATEDINLCVKEISNVEGEAVYAAWICSTQINMDVVRTLEDHIQSGQDMSKEVDKLCGTSENLAKTVRTLIYKTRRVCKKYNMDKIFIIGEYPRALSMKQPLCSITGLDFSGTRKEQVRKFGGILAKELGIQDSDIHYGNTVTMFYYKGLKLEFNARFKPDFIQDLMTEHDVKMNSLSIDIFNRDFTINMLAYNVMDKKLYDLTGRSIEDIEKQTIQTYFDPVRIVEENPTIMLRALSLSLKYGFEIGQNLSYAMYLNAEKLFNGSVSTDVLLAAREQIIRQAGEEAEQIFSNYGMEKILQY